MRRGKRILAWMLTMLMMFSLLPTMVWAEATPCGELSGKLKVKGHVAVDLTLSADYSEVKPEGMTDDYVTFQWLRKIDEKETVELSTEKTYKVVQEDLGYELILEITAVEGSEVTGSLKMTTNTVMQTEEEAIILEEQKKAEEEAKEALTEELLQETEIVEEVAEELPQETEIVEEVVEELPQETEIVEEVVEELPQETQNDYFEESTSEEYVSENGTENSAASNDSEFEVVVQEESGYTEEKEEALYQAELTIDTENGCLDFVVFGEQEIEELQYVTITNTGNQTLHFTEIAPEYFMVQDVEEPLEPGESIKLWIRPRDAVKGTDAEYNEEIIYKTEEGVEVSFAANVTVVSDEMEEADPLEGEDSEMLPTEEIEGEDDSEYEVEPADETVEEKPVEENTEGKFAIMADLSEITFSEKQEGYTETEQKELVITNTGTDAVTLLLPQLTTGYFECNAETAEQEIVLLSGESTKFIFSQVEGLSEGVYEEMVAFSILEDSEATISVKLSGAITEQNRTELMLDQEYLEFESREEGYENAPEEQQITITNTGNCKVVLEQPYSENFELGELSTLELGVDESVVLSVRPKMGLTEGNYQEEIGIALVADEDGNTEILSVLTVNFDVTKPVNRLTAIEQLAEVPEAENGTEKTIEALKLPQTVMIHTLKGEETAQIQWDLDSCKYDPAEKAAQSFRVKGTVILPQGVENPDNISLVVSVYVKVKAAKEEPVKVQAESKIVGIDANAVYTTDTKITFTAVGGGMDNTDPSEGDLREFPLYWSVRENKTWEGAPYTATFRIGVAGDYTLTVVFKGQKFDGSNWIDTGKRTEKQVSFRVVKAQASISPAVSVTPGPAQKTGVNTGDTTNILPFVILLFAAVGCIGGVVIYRRRK